MPFGEEFAASGTQQKQHFTSYERDSETATDYALNRQYNQGIGRFNRVDPYRGSNDNNDPQSFNRYSYVKNDPVGATDPLGLDELPPLGPKPDELIANPNNPNPMEWPDDWWWGGNPYSYEPNPYDGGGFFMTVPTPSFNLADFLLSMLNAISLLSPGKLTSDGNCGHLAYLGEQEPSNKLEKWIETSGAFKDVEADFVASPKGVVKIPNGCSCALACKDYSILCSCTPPRKAGPIESHAPEVMHSANWDKDLTNPSERFNWIGESYMRKYLGTIDIPVNFPIGGLTVPGGDSWWFD